MTTDTVIVRYGEISLKGKNRRHFELQLREGIAQQLRREGRAHEGIELRRGRLYIHGCSSVPDLHLVLGVLSFSPARRIDLDFDRLAEAIPEIYPLLSGKRSFRVSCQRINKRFPIDSPTLEREIGARIHEDLHLPVNLEKPEADVGIEIGEEAAYLFLERRRGFGGFPYGSAGRLVSLISGGIDSPVATFLMMKRGVAPILVHFQIWPEDEGESGKLLALKRRLEEYAAGREIPLHLIPRDELFAGRFAEIYESRFQPYVCLLCKYLMHQRAQEIAESAGALGLITGDNLAQVASQTLANLHAQRHWNRLPVYSPLIAYEKNETMALARLIGTYDLSIGSERGCRAPASPKTAVSPERLERILRETGLWKEPPQST